MRKLVIISLFFSVTLNTYGNPTVLQKVAIIDVSPDWEHCKDLAVDGQTLYVGVYNNTGGSSDPAALLSYDVSDSTNLSQSPIGMVTTQYTLHDLKLYGDIAYLCNGWFAIVDILEPNSLSVLCRYDESNPPTPYQTAFLGVDVDGDYAFVTDHWQGLRVIDISGPCPLYEIGSPLNLEYFEHGIKLYGTTLYAPTAHRPHGAYLYAIDVSNPSSPTVISRLALPLAPDQLVLSDDGGYAYIAAFEGGLQIVRISDPANMELVGSYPLSDAQDITREENTVFVADTDRVAVVDVTNPSEPVLLDSYTLPGEPTRIVAHNGFIYASCQGVGKIVILAAREPGTILLLEPNGGEELIAGKTYTINWLVWQGGDPNATIEYSDNNGIDWNMIDPNTGNDGSYEWTVPAVTSNQCLVRISDANDPNLSDTSDDLFTIYVCQLSSQSNLDNDCDVDFVDFSIWVQDWLKNGNPFDPAYTEAPQGMVVIPGGEFEMGRHVGAGDADELPVHAVYVDSFYMCKYGITNQQYSDYLNNANSLGQLKVDGGIVYAVDDTGNSFPYCNMHSYDASSQIEYLGGVFSVNIKDGTTDMSNHPMVTVSWYGCVAYCNWRSGEEGYESCYDTNNPNWPCDFSKQGYRLPTEAEREYAARGGNHSPYYCYPWGNSIDGSMANYWSSGDPFETGAYPWTTPVGYYDGNQIPAGTDMANGYGLYDMAGNAYEWCNDWYSSTYYSTTPYPHVNPTGPSSGSYRIRGGGPWINTPFASRVADRTGGPPDIRHSNGSFRIVLDLDN